MAPGPIRRSGFCPVLGAARCSGLPGARGCPVLGLPGARAARCSGCPVLGLPGARARPAPGPPGARGCPAPGPTRRLGSCPVLGAARCSGLLLWFSAGWGSPVGLVVSNGGALPGGVSGWGAPAPAISGWGRPVGLWCPGGAPGSGFCLGGAPLPGLVSDAGAPLGGLLRGRGPRLGREPPVGRPGWERPTPPEHPA